MKFIRELDTNVKLHACFAILLGLGLLTAGWLLLQLGELHELTALMAQRLGPAAGAAQAAESLRNAYFAATAWTWVFIALYLALGAMLAAWLGREAARPIHAAVLVARRVAEGDLSMRIEAAAAGDSGLLMRAMREMHQKLVAMIVQVRAGTDTISSAAGEIATGSMDLSARTEEQAASLEETAASMEQLTATVKQNAEHAYQASKLAVSASEVAVKGGEVVSEVVGTMASINDSSKRIAEIIGVIDGIAFQTNILALNAAVEAARAGEQGRGFAVVAAEVRNLAQRSAAAAKEIKELIDDSVEKVSAGTLLADKAGNTMNDVVNSVKRVTEIIGEIAAASAEQTTGIEQVNLAIAAMDQATQCNAALVEESAAAAASMRDQAASLKYGIGAFVLGAEHARPAPQMHLIARQPGTAAGRASAAPPRPLAAARKPAAPASGAGKRGSAARQDLDWEEF